MGIAQDAHRLIVESSFQQIPYHGPVAYVRNGEQQDAVVAQNLMRLRVLLQFVAIVITLAGAMSTAELGVSRPYIYVLKNKG